MKSLAIELTNKCNATCDFCINSRFNKKLDMSDEILDKVLKDAKEFDLEFIFLNNIGESFLCEDIIDKLKKVRTAFPKTRIITFSNGSLLTNQILKEIKKLDITLNISLNSASPEGRLERMGLNDFTRVKKLIDKGIKMKVIKRVTFVEQSPLIPHPALKINSPKNEVNEFWKLYPKNGQVIPYANFAGSLFDTFNPKQGCRRAMREMAVLADGTVTLCCMTALKVSFGNIKEKTLKEIWESKERQDYKIAAERGETFGICSNCTGA